MTRDDDVHEDGKIAVSIEEEPSARRLRKLRSLRWTLAAAGGISDSTRRRIPDFPQPVVLSRTGRGKPARIAFVEDEVLGWCERRIAQHRGAA